MKPVVKKVLIGGGILAVLGIGFFIVKNRSSSGDSSFTQPASKQDRFIAAAFDPTTPWGAEVKAYLEPQGRYTADVIRQVANTHIGANSPQYQNFV